MLALKRLAAFENWEPAIQVYRANFAHNIHKIDIGNWQESLGCVYIPDKTPSLDKKT